MRIYLKSALSSLPLLATANWPEGVWDKLSLHAQAATTAAAQDELHWR